MKKYLPFITIFTVIIIFILMPRDNKKSQIEYLPEDFATPEPVKTLTPEPVTGTKLPDSTESGNLLLPRDLQ